VTVGTVIPFRRPSLHADPEPVIEPPTVSDEALVAACALGEHTALGVLFDRHHRLVYGFLSRLAGTDERDLEDLVQATFLEALRAAKKFRGDAAVMTWLCGIATNVVRHHVRSEVRRKTFTTKLAAVPRRPATEPGAIVERDQMMQRVRAAVDALPEKQRVVYVMCELQELPGVEVARVLDLREGTVWRLLYQARVALRAALEGGPT
jgi:RNA polymerase sigma-70 factor, ECF subfamily